MARILVIDDEEDVRAVVGGALRTAGHEVLFAPEGAQGLTLMRSPQGKSVQLVITDILMPEKEGLETIRDLKSEFPDIRIIAMSGGGKVLKSTSHFFTADELGAHAVLRKPFDTQTLLDTVRTALPPR
jgi:DNA-binding NtrC family response regulator